MSEPNCRMDDKQEESLTGEKATAPDLAIATRSADSIANTNPFDLNRTPDLDTISFCNEPVKIEVSSPSELNQSLDLDTTFSEKQQVNMEISSQRSLDIEQSQPMISPAHPDEIVTDTANGDGK